MVSWNRVPQSRVILRPTGAERPVFDGSRATGSLHYWMNTAPNGSSDNRFTGNVMARVTGDPVRLRHDTHRNVFYRNTFVRSGSRYAHRAMASFWRFWDTEVCGTDNRVERNAYDGRFYGGEAAQRIIGSGSEPGIESCPEAIRAYANVLDPSPVVP